MSAIKKTVAKTTTTTTTTTTKAVQAPARKVVEDRKRNKQVIVLLDESYSMLGDRWKAAVSGGQSVLMSLSENNYFGLSAYASEFREIYKPMNISKGGEGKSAKGKPYATRRDEINASILKLWWRRQIHQADRSRIKIKISQSSSESHHQRSSRSSVSLRSRMHQAAVWLQVRPSLWK